MFEFLKPPRLDLDLSYFVRPAAVAQGQELRSPPETKSLAFDLPSATDFDKALPASFKGQRPFNHFSGNTALAYAAWTELLEKAAVHPIADWKIIATRNHCAGYKDTVWGFRQYVLRTPERGYRIEEVFEEGYDGKVCAATSVMVFDQLTSDAAFNRSRALMYANDDWGTLPLQILEDRFALAERRLPRRALFKHAVLALDAFAPLVKPGGPFPQPAPVTITVPADLSFGKEWSGAPAQNSDAERGYLDLLASAARQPLENWRFRETLAEGFGRKGVVWGRRVYEMQREQQVVALEETVTHNGWCLESTCRATIRTAAPESRAILELGGGWAELPYQYLERRTEAAQLQLPQRVPFVTRPNTPGIYVR